MNRHTKRQVTMVLVVMGALAIVGGCISCAVWLRHHAFAERERHIVRGDGELLEAARAVLDSPLDDGKQETLRELIGRDLPRGTAAALVERYIADNFEDVDLTHERGVPPWDFDYFYRVPVLARTK